MRSWPLPVLAGAAFLALLAGYLEHWAVPAGLDSAALSAGYDAFAGVIKSGGKGLAEELEANGYAGFIQEAAE